MNAKLIDPGEQDDGIGPHIFGQGQHINREEGQRVEENRFRFQEYLITTKTTLANTLFPKRPQGLITYRLDKTAGDEPPYDRTKYETIDYFFTHNKWRNSIRNVYSDMQAGIDTDHFPLLMHIRIKLKAEYGKTTTKPKFIPCTDEQRLAFHSQIKTNITTAHSHEQLVNCIRTAAEANMTKKSPNPSRPYEYSQDTETLLDQNKQNHKSEKEQTIQT